MLVPRKTKRLVSEKRELTIRLGVLLGCMDAILPANTTKLDCGSKEREERERGGALHADVLRDLEPKIGYEE